MARLRDPEHGCPWDREQDFATIAPYTIEEAYEVADAIERGDMAALKDELGDLLFQVVFHARMAEEAGLFAFEDVAAAIADKMVRRHPHVFGDAEIASVAAQNEAWEAHKAAEREPARRPESAESVLDGVALALPALLRAGKDPGARGADRLRLARCAGGLREDRRGDRRAQSRARRALPIGRAGGRDGRYPLRRRQPRPQARASIPRPRCAARPRNSSAVSARVLAKPARRLER